ncbi:MAG: helix-turn-helix transcriptional regulator [Bdellovibrionota bacterium]
MAKIVLEEVLKKKGISKYKFAQMLGVHQPTVFRYLKPDYDPKFSTLERWAKVLDCKIKDLFKE